MDNYLVSARKYRPSKFEEVVGQKHITKTLNNAILNNQIAHAYLFCGPRGVGKTTCARIFANAVNKGTKTEYNIFELDAASNNGVDHIRQLIEQVKIPPQIGKYKIYIIDEVHMLSDAAFNAFLKTLEEPPKHSIFILATTEKNKLIPTILSRCQIFDFQKITINDISSHLADIAKKENIQVSLNTLQFIADKADGSLRDSLSTFDKVHAYCNKEWHHEEVLQILSSLDISFSLKLTTEIINKNISNCLLTIDNVLQKGFNEQEIINVLISHFRNLIIAKDSTTLKLIKEDEKTLNAIISQSENFSKEQIVLALNCLNDCEKDYKNSINKRFVVELCIMQLCGLSEMLFKKKNLIPEPTNIINRVFHEEAEEKKEINTQEAEKKEINTQEAEKKEINTQEAEKKEINTQEAEKKEINTQYNQHKETHSGKENTLISITDELRNENTNKSIQTIKNKTHTWTELEMTQAWTEFSNDLNRNKKTNLYNIFNRHIPQKNKNDIILEVISLSEKSALEEIKGELLIFLKRKLENDSINLAILIKEEKEERNMLYTKEEKYKHILEKNNKIKLLKDKLDLNII